MSEELRPALDADDWKDREYDLTDYGYGFRAAIERGELTVSAWAGDDVSTDYTESTRIPAAALPALIALANAVRAEGDAGKLTDRMVLAVEQAAGEAEGRAKPGAATLSSVGHCLTCWKPLPGGSHYCAEHLAVTLRATAAALRSILPRESADA